MHRESTAIWDTLRRNCIARGEPSLIEGTLTWLPLGAQLLISRWDGGYDCVRIIAVDVPEEAGSCEVRRRIAAELPQAKWSRVDHLASVGAHCGSCLCCSWTVEFVAITTVLTCEMSVPLHCSQFSANLRIASYLCGGSRSNWFIGNVGKLSWG